MIDYEKALSHVLSTMLPEQIRELYANTDSSNTKKAIGKWWNARYRKRLKD